MDKEIDTIKNMKENGAFKKYIEYIVFPYYKNLVPGTKINLEFPITILVGKNGSGKSSTLHALYGAPYWKSCADFWFSTEVDPIEETGGEGKNRFFYGYREDKQSEIKEVMKTRMRRGSKTKEEDPDYWETSKPIKKDGMTAQTRNDPVKKEVVYLDFRAEVSAFDKIFHFAKGDISGKKDLLRKRSKYLNRLFNGEAMRFPGAPDEKVGVVKELNDEMKKKISSILGKEYVSIKVAEHSLFKNPGTSIYVKTKLSSRYSEANAGSGEVAVIQLVKKIEEAQEYSLILLDEPEVSIHPGAQEKLKEYLLEVTKRKKLQVVISSHSPILIRDMPSEAIKLYITNSQGRFEVKENVDYREAFYDLQEIRLHGGNREMISEELQLECHKKENVSYTDTYGIIDPDKPAPTITSGCTIISKGRYCHPTQNRGLSIREAARLQSFDDKFEFQGNMGEMSLQIGNAVPPKLAQASGKVIINYMGLYEDYLEAQTKGVITP